MRVIITGAASGIGAATAQALTHDRLGTGPHTLLLVDRDLDGLRRFADELDGPAEILQVDLANPDCGTRIAKAADDLWGGVDGLVSNAGIIRGASLADLTVENFDTMMAVNTRATWLVAQAVRPLMIRVAGGSVVATASISARHPTPPLGAYAASKAALVMLVRQMANEWGPDGIRCNCVSPGPTLTPMTAAGYADADRRRAREAGLPLGRIGSPHDTAAVIAFLLCDLARQVTGVDLLVDGGLDTTLMTASGAGRGHTSGG